MLWFAVNVCNTNQQVLCNITCNGFLSFFFFPRHRRRRAATKEQLMPMEFEELPSSKNEIFLSILQPWQSPIPDFGPPRITCELSTGKVAEKERTSYPESKSWATRERGPRGQPEKKSTRTQSLLPLAINTHYIKRIFPKYAQFKLRPRENWMWEDQWHAAPLGMGVQAKMIRSEPFWVVQPFSHSFVGAKLRTWFQAWPRTWWTCKAIFPLICGAKFRASTVSSRTRFQA